MSELAQHPVTHPIQPAAHAADKPEANILKGSTVMMVDDEPITLEVVHSFLEDAGYQRIITLDDPTKALEMILSEKPDVLLLDLMMPGVSGFDILTLIRDDARLHHMPVIVLTAATDSATKLKALELGATDLLAKPVDASELVLRLRNTLAAKAYVDRIASIDSLTGLYNRRVFGDQIERTLNLAQRKERTGALLHINVDQFKKINDALGPALGDQYLQAIAARLEQCIRSSDSIARIGTKDDLAQLSRLSGDEFGVLLTEVDKSDNVNEIARRCLQAMEEPIYLGGHEVYVTCSIGIAVFPEDGTDRDTLVQRAGVALKSAKARGGNTACFYSAALNDRSLHVLNLTTELRRAIAQGELRLFYQPKVDARTRELVGAEALVRWVHPKRGLVSPGEFIPVAEESGLIVEMGTWVMGEACRQIDAWLDRGLAAPPVSVNISGRQFAQKNFVHIVEELLRQYTFDRQHLKMELTESYLMHNVEDNLRTLKAIRDLGLHLSLDDFGTGYSSLSYLSRFPINELKIDQSFVRRLGVAGTDNGESITIAIIAMARALNLDVVAEGVETEAQAAFLLAHNCDQFQGYLFGKPMPAEEFTNLLVNRGDDVQSISTLTATRNGIAIEPTLPADTAFQHDYAALAQRPAPGDASANWNSR